MSTLRAGSRDCGVDSGEAASSRATNVTRQLLGFAEIGIPVKRRMAVESLGHEACTMALQNTSVQGVVSLPERV